MKRQNVISSKEGLLVCCWVGKIGRTAMHLCPAGCTRVTCAAGPRQKVDKPKYRVRALCDRYLEGVSGAIKSQRDTTYQRATRGVVVDR
jgi:hypothetical protein